MTLSKEVTNQIKNTRGSYIVEFSGGDKGIAIFVWENLSDTWQSGDIIVFLEGGGVV